MISLWCLVELWKLLCCHNGRLDAAAEAEVDSPEDILNGTIRFATTQRKKKKKKQTN